MDVKCIKVGELETNCYILQINGDVLIIDPGADKEKIIPFVGGLNVGGIIVTHYHFDHVGALEGIKKLFDAEIYDFKNLKIGRNEIGNFSFEMIRTPGHKEDAISIYFEDEQVMFTGDFVFKGTIGRWDLKGGNFASMKESIYKILKYPNDITLYPGHGEKTKLCAEKDNLEKFLKHF